MRRTRRTRSAGSRRSTRRRGSTRRSTWRGRTRACAGCRSSCWSTRRLTRSSRRGARGTGRRSRPGSSTPNGAIKPSFLAYLLPIYLPATSFQHGQSLLVWAMLRPAPNGIEAAGDGPVASRRRALPHACDASRRRPEQRARARTCSRRGAARSGSSGASPAGLVLDSRPVAVHGALAPAAQAVRRVLPHALEPVAGLAERLSRRRAPPRIPAARADHDGAGGEQREHAGERSEDHDRRRQRCVGGGGQRPELERAAASNRRRLPRSSPAPCEQPPLARSASARSIAFGKSELYACW